MHEPLISMLSTKKERERRRNQQRRLKERKGKAGWGRDKQESLTRKV